MKKLPPGILILSILAGILSACKPQEASQDPTSFEPHPPTAAALQIPGEASPPLAEGTYLGLTYQQAYGNRLVPGKGQIPNYEPINIDLSGQILWLAGVPFREGVLWTAVLEDGGIESYAVEGGQVQDVDLGRELLPPGMPPMILAHEGEIYLNAAPGAAASEFSHPLSPLADPGQVVFIDKNGDLVQWEGEEEIGRLKVNALPDARLIQDENGRLLFYSDPTDFYDHGVLGDGLEAGSITLVETSPALGLIRRIEIPPPGVLEGIAPIWVDLNGDAEREILVTISDFSSGARLVLFNEEGQVLAEGPAAGQAYRWRHQIAAAPLGPEGQILIVDVLRPHLDATLEFFAWEGNELQLRAALPGFSTHGIGSRNLDMALVGDLNGDGSYEIAAPDLSREFLLGVGLENGKPEILWTQPLGGKLTSNLAGVSLGDGSLSLAAGVGSRLLVWE